MRVLVLAEQLAAPATGIGRYTTALVAAALADDALDVVVACTRQGAPRAEALGAAPGSIVALPDPLLVRSAASLAGVGRRRRPDVVHGTKHFVALRRTPTVLTVHDLYALDGGPSLRARPLRWGYGRSLAHATVLAPTNEGLARELRQRLHVDPARIVVYRPLAALGSAAAVAVDAAPPTFALHVSDLDERKNAGLLLDLWPEVHARTGVPLVLVGARHAASRHGAEVAELAAAGLVVDLGPVSDGELAWLYARAEALLFPSRREGWGYPVEEALAAGCPVVSSPVPSLAAAEAGADQLTVLDPADRAGWLDAAVAACEPATVPGGARPGRAEPGPAGPGDLGALRHLYERAVASNP